MNVHTDLLTPSRVEYSIHPATSIGYVALKVTNLESQIAFYQQTLGLSVHWRDENNAGLGAGHADLLQLSEMPDLKRYRYVTGLYHFAVVFPDRHELARVVARLFTQKIRNFPTDHVMTKSTYLNDPEGNGIELYAESPEDGMFLFENGDFVTRRADGRVSDGREPLDLDALFSHLMPDDRLDGAISPLAHLGHVHLHVRDVDEAVAFYHGVLGFDVMGTSKSFQAAFVSAGGYHHHIGLNTWQGVGAPPPPADAAGLRYFTIKLPDPNALNEVIARVEKAGISTSWTENGLFLQDPSHNGIMLTSG
jgi:catechol 2,3-dioxygenase